jgi:outer membrane protein insertion porin family
MRAEELAGRLDVEYRVPLHRGGKGIRGIDAYARVGLYSLARLEDVRLAIPGYDGAARFPLDLTFDLGVHADTTIGVFQFGFSSLVRSLPDL